MGRFYYLTMDLAATACLLALVPQIASGQLGIGLALPFAALLAGAYGLSRMPPRLLFEPRLLGALLTEPGRHGSALGYVWFLSLSLAMPTLLGYVIGAALKGS